MNQLEIGWSPLPTLHDDSGDRYEVAPLMAPKSITLLAHTLLHHGERFKVVGDWEAFIGGGVVLSKGYKTYAT